MSSSSTTSNNDTTAHDDSNNNTNNSDDGPGLSLPDRDKELALSTLQSKITQHYQRGDFGTALEVSKDLLRQTEQHFGKDHPATASSYNNVGLMHKLLGDFIEARSHYNVAMRIYAKVVGRDHASYAMTLHNLGSLNKSQIHFDTTLKATERLTLVETALEYLEEALEIRIAELGPEHPHTVATRSAIGSTLAAQVLHQHKLVVTSNENTIQGKFTSAEAAKAAQRAVTANGTTSLTPPPPSLSTPSSESISTTDDSNIQHQHRQYISLNPEDITREQWKAAEDHLREALQTAIDNPRGKRIGGGSGAGGGGGSKKNNKKKRNTGKKQQSAKKGDSSDGRGKIATLSAASAGQNLAVFLKSMAMTSNPYDTDKFNEAKDLYEQVSRVRSKLLPAGTGQYAGAAGVGNGGGPSLHPDLYATKFSLAELLEVMGDEETANAIRQEILDTYEPSSIGSNDHARDDDASIAPSQVVIEKTKGSPPPAS